MQYKNANRTPKISFRYLKNPILYEYFSKIWNCRHFALISNTIQRVCQPSSKALQQRSADPERPNDRQSEPIAPPINAWVTASRIRRPQSPPHPNSKSKNQKFSRFVGSISCLVSNWSSAYQECLGSIKDTVRRVAGWVEWYAGGWDG